MNGDVSCSQPHFTTWRNPASRRLVARTSSGHYSLRRLRHLRHAPRLRRQILRMGSLSFSVLFASAFSSLVEAVSRAAHSRRTSRLPSHLLLLSQSLLPRLLP